MEKEGSKELSELRRDPVSGDWVIISSGRARRPDSFKSRSSSFQETPVNLCPFENPKEFGNDVVKIYEDSKKTGWAVQVVKNKFPIIKGEGGGFARQIGPYSVIESAGDHEVVVFKDHKKSFAELDLLKIGQILRVYRERHQELKKKECVEYVLIIHNHGPEAGASISHPHSQILALPFVPSDVKRSLEGSRKYFLERKRCVHCDILDFELKSKKRVVFENKSFAVLVPFAPKFSYELRIFPKTHQPYFEETEDGVLDDLAEALKTALGKMYHGFNDPAYNFFIHTPPVDRSEEHDSYHWHLEINPRLNVWGGFELGTGGDVIDTDPDQAAEYLREIRI